MCLFEVMLSHNVDTKLYLQAYAYERNILLFGRYEIRPSSTSMFIMIKIYKTRSRICIILHVPACIDDLNMNTAVFFIRQKKTK